MEIYIEKKMRRDMHVGVTIVGDEYITYFKDWLRIKGVYEFGIIVKSEQLLNREQLAEALLAFIKATPELEVHDSRGSNWLEPKNFAEAIKPDFQYFDSWFNEISSYREWMFFHSGKEWEGIYHQLKEIDQSAGLKNFKIGWNRSGAIPKPIVTSKALEQTATAVFGDIEMAIIYNDHYVGIKDVQFTNGIEGEFDESKLSEKVRDAIIDRSDSYKHRTDLSSDFFFTVKFGEKTVNCHKRESSIEVMLELQRLCTTERVVLKAAGYRGSDDDNVTHKGALGEEVRIMAPKTYNRHDYVKASVMEAGENWLKYKMYFDISELIN